MRLNDIHTVYMLGIGGIGMSALARFFHKQGIAVSGYDKTPSPITEALQAEGIDVSFDENDSVPPNATYIYTPAVPKEHPAFEKVRSDGGQWFKRSEALQWITDQHSTIAVAGTHGKTTTTAFTAYLLNELRGGCSAFVGGVMANYDSNLVTSDSTDWVLVEADEYDRSFLRLNPKIAVITSLDPDHLDIYGTFDEMKKDYQTFASRAELLILHESVQNDFEHPNKLIYGLEESSDRTIHSVSVDEGSFRFSVDEVSGFTSNLAGLHNVNNATAALLVCRELGIDDQRISEGLASFRGVKRRFEKVFQDDRKVVIDDYAHHPKEIDAALDAARMLYPTKSVAIVFQPHLFTRTRDFEDGFAMSLSKADEVILIPIYPARELPIDGVSSAELLNKLTLKTKQLVQKADLVKAVLSLSADVVLILGAGDIDRFVQPIAKAFEAQTYVD